MFIHLADWFQHRWKTGICEYNNEQNFFSLSIITDLSVIPAFSAGPTILGTNKPVSLAAQKSLPASKLSEHRGGRNPYIAGFWDDRVNADKIQYIYPLRVTALWTGGRVVPYIPGLPKLLLFGPESLILTPQKLSCVIRRTS